MWGPEKTQILGSAGSRMVVALLFNKNQAMTLHDFADVIKMSPRAIRYAWRDLIHYDIAVEMWDGEDMRLHLL